jgi:hypothetical protein
LMKASSSTFSSFDQVCTGGVNTNLQPTCMSRRLPAGFMMPLHGGNRHATNIANEPQKRLCHCSRFMVVAPQNWFQGLVVLCGRARSHWVLDCSHHGLRGG